MEQASVLALLLRRGEVPEAPEAEPRHPVHVHVASMMRASAALFCSAVPGH